MTPSVLAKGRWITRALLLSALLGRDSSAQDTTRLRWVPNPRVTTGSWVSDPSQRLARPTVAKLDSVIGALHAQTTVEMTVVVLDTLDGLEPTDAALLLHRRWGVGSIQRDNGIVFLLSPRLRKTHVSVGYGLEGVLPDARVGRILDQFAVPHFRRDAFDEGLLATVPALAAVAATERNEGLPRARSFSATQNQDPYADQGRVRRTIGDFLANNAGIAFFGLIGSTFLLAIGYAVARKSITRHWPRRCPKGHGALTRLAEEIDQRLLSPGQQVEEKLGSVDYDVWTCGTCTYKKVVPYRKLFSKYSPCPSCKSRTCVSSRRTVTAATYTSAGVAEVSHVCKHCGYVGRTEEPIPMLTRSTSSGSSGWSGGSSSGGSSSSSSFGGGTSGGGGAGRSF